MSIIFLENTVLFNKNDQTILFYTSKDVDISLGDILLKQIFEIFIKCKCLYIDLILFWFIFDYLATRRKIHNSKYRRYLVSIPNHNNLFFEKIETKNFCKAIKYLYYFLCSNIKNIVNTRIYILLINIIFCFRFTPLI